MRAFLVVTLAAALWLSTSAFSVQATNPLCIARHHHHRVVVHCVRPDNDWR